MAKNTAELTVYCDAIADGVKGTKDEVAAVWAALEQLRDQFQQSQLAAARSGEELAHSRRQLDEAREAVKATDRENVALRADLATLRQDLALLRQRFDDHLKRVEEWDRRRWGMYGLLAGAILSFAANLVVAYVRR